MHNLASVDIWTLSGDIENSLPVARLKIPEGEPHLLRVLRRRAGEMIDLASGEIAA
jgi:hypothetical protein